MDGIRTFITANPMVAIALSGLWGAMLIDVLSFLKSKTPGEFFAQFSPSVALWRYAQGIVGALVGTTALAAGATVVTLLIWLVW